MQYSEVRELVTYLLRNYAHLLRPGDAASLLVTLSDDVDEDSTELRIVDGPSGIHVEALEICERILDVHGGAIAIARCPRCKRIVREPEELVCPWCEFRWRAR